MPPQTPNLTLYFLQASRSIRVAWVLEELRLPYTLVFSSRENQKAPPAFKTASGSPLGKFPCLRDAQPGGDVVLHESGAIVEYLLDYYGEGGGDGDGDRERKGKGRLMPGKDKREERAKAQAMMHAAEGAVMVHALAIMYLRWHLPAEARGALAATEAKMAGNVRNDLSWLEVELEGGGFLVGEGVGVADVMLHFSVEFTVERELGVTKKEFAEQYPRLEAWLQRCRELETYRRAVEKTGYTLYPKDT